MKCEYPIPDTLHNGKKKRCDTRAKVYIIFQDKRIKVCNSHKSNNGK